MAQSRQLCEIYRMGPIIIIPWKNCNVGFGFGLIPTGIGPTEIRTRVSCILLSDLCNHLISSLIGHRIASAYAKITIIIIIFRFFFSCSLNKE